MGLRSEDRDVWDRAGAQSSRTVEGQGPVTTQATPSQFALRDESKNSKLKCGLPDYDEDTLVKVKR